MKGLSKVGSTNDEVLQGVGELKAGDDFRLCLRWLLSIQLDYAGNSVNSTFGLSLSSVTFRSIFKLTISLLEVYITSFVACRIIRSSPLVG